jgi:hypothetical protein
MTDRDQMVEEIHAAMLAVDQAHAATENLREKADREALEQFQVQMKALYRRLEQMKAILAHEDTFTLDELAEAISETLSQRETYHRIARVEPKK